LDMDAVFEMLTDLNFSQVKINSQKEIYLEDELLNKYLDDNALSDFRRNDIGIYSITITGYK